MIARRSITAGAGRDPLQTTVGRETSRRVGRRWLDPAAVEGVCAVDPSRGGDTWPAQGIVPRRRNPSSTTSSMTEHAPMPAPSTWLAISLPRSTALRWEATRLPWPTS